MSTLNSNILQCPYCSRTSSRGTGLASHIRGAHSEQYASWTRSRSNAPATPSRESGTSGHFSGHGLQDVVSRLEKQRAAIDRALDALRSLGVPVQQSQPTRLPVAPGKRRNAMTPEGRRRLAESMTRRWAAKRTAAQAKKKAA